MSTIKQKLKVYLPFLENELKRNLAYKGSFYLIVLCSCFGPFISYYLWMAIYGCSSTSVMGGFTQNEMILYVFMTYVTSNMVMVGIATEIDNDVKEGAVSMTLIKPIDYRMNLIFKALGTVVYQFLAPGVFVWIGLEIYKVSVLEMPITSLVNIVLYIISTMLSIFLYLLFDFCFGMVSFVTTYMFGMNMAKNALFSFLSGQLIPISFFPGMLREIFEFLPFSSMIYTPVMIYLGKYNGEELAFVLLHQLFWVIALYALGSFLWGRITRRLIVLGG